MPLHSESGAITSSPIDLSCTAHINSASKAHIASCSKDNHHHQMLGNHIGFSQPNVSSNNNNSGGSSDSGGTNPNVPSRVSPIYIEENQSLSLSYNTPSSNATAKPLSIPFGSSMPQSTPSAISAASTINSRSRHSRTASYGTSLLDSLNESKMMQSHAFAPISRPSQRGHSRHMTVTTLWDDGDDDSDPLLESSIANRFSADIMQLRSSTPSHSKSTSPPNASEDTLRAIGSTLSRPTNVLDNINELPNDSASHLGATAAGSDIPGSVAVSSTSGHGISGIISTSSPLRNSYSSTSLRSAFIRPRGSTTHVPNLSTASIFDGQIWGTITGGSKSTSPDKEAASTSDMLSPGRSVASLMLSKRAGRHMRHESEILPGQLGAGMRAVTSSISGLASSINMLELEEYGGLSLGSHAGAPKFDSTTGADFDALTVTPLRENQPIAAAATLADIDQSSRLRSYSFTKPIEDDDLDIDTLHAVATSDNPTAILRKAQVTNLLRSHSRSKTMANPLGESQPFRSTQPSSASTSLLPPNTETLGTQLVSLNGTSASTGLDTVGPRNFLSGSLLDPSSIAARSGGRMSRAHSRQNSANIMPEMISARQGTHTPGASIPHVAGSVLSIGAHHHPEGVKATAGVGGTVLIPTEKPPGAAAAPTDSTITPTRSLWVGNVDPSLSSETLISKFGKYGRVESLRLLPDRQCAFVNFMRLEDAISARENMQGARLGNCIIRVNYGKGENYASSDAQAMQPTRALWVGNISSSATTQLLEEVFSKFGAIESARILSHKNCGFVNFERLEDAVRAKQEMNGKELQGNVVRIGYAKEPVKGGPEAQNKRCNPVPNAAPLTVSGRLAEASASVGTTSSGLGNNEVLEPDYSLRMDETLVAMLYATELPGLPAPKVRIINSNHNNGLNQQQQQQQHSSQGAADHSTMTSMSLADLLGGLIRGPDPTDTAASGDISTIDQIELREVRKRLENKPSRKDFAAIFDALLPACVELCTDYVGNVLIQRLIEGSDAQQRLRLVEQISPHIASIGVHKNGTWAVQKMIDTAFTPEEQEVIVKYIKYYTPQLLLDQLGNYVVQCCLPFQDGRNQFIFDAVHGRCQEIAQGRFGARSIRTCLEHRTTTRAQQKLVAVALVMNSVTLSTNSNGSLLMNWLVDTSNFPGRFRVLAPQLAGHLRHLSTHKLGSSLIIKIVDQTLEPDARDLILNTMFFNPDPQVLGDILSDQVHGINVVYAILTGKGIEDSEKIRIAHVVQQTLQSYLHQGVQSYHRLYEIAAEIIRQGGNGILNGGGIAYGGIIGAMPGYANGMSATVGLPGAHTPTSYHPHHPLQIQQPHQQAVSYPYGGLALNTAGISGGYTYGVHAMPGTAQQVMVPPGSSIRTGFISPMEGHLPASMSVSDGVHHHQLAPDLPALSTITATSGIVNPALEDNHYEQRPVMVATRAGSNEPQ